DALVLVVALERLVDHVLHRAAEPDAAVGAAEPGEARADERHLGVTVVGGFVERRRRHLLAAQTASGFPGIEAAVVDERIHGGGRHGAQGYNVTRTETNAGRMRRLHDGRSPQRLPRSDLPAATLPELDVRRAPVLVLLHDEVQLLGAGPDAPGRLRLDQGGPRHLRDAPPPRLRAVGRPQRAARRPLRRAAVV